MTDDFFAAWKQAKRIARALDNAIRAKNKEAMMLHKEALIEALDKLQKLNEAKNERE